MSNNQKSHSFLNDVKDRIKKAEFETVVNEVGSVISLGDGIVLADGLNNIMLNEIVRFESGVEGMALNLEEATVGIVLLGEFSNIKEGDKVYRTHRIVQVPVGDALLGRVVNALGQQIDNKGEIETTKSRVIERVAPGVMDRKSVHQPLETGILSIDAMFPIGKGQRELIIGDRQTGKTTIAIDTIINQKGKNVNCVYVAIGQKNSTVANVVRTLEANGALEYTTVVAANASDLPALQYIAPFTGVSIAEEWMHEGKDVLIIYDDLSKHAIAYRTLTLLLRRPPGREAYPGDVFYLHSRLLERACKLKDELGAGSITALPIIETQAGDISAYIPTNVISITDGQLFMQTSLFNAGQRPAIDAGQSVSRVGSAAQIKSIKQTGASLKLELANYRELEAFSQFGSDLDEETKKILALGKAVMAVIKQAPNKPYSQTDEAIILFTVKEKMIPQVPVEKIQDFKEFLLDYFKGTKLRADLEEKKAFDKENTPAFRCAVQKAINLFLHKNAEHTPCPEADQIAYDEYAINKTILPVEETPAPVEFVSQPVVEEVLEREEIVVEAHEHDFEIVDDSEGLEVNVTEDVDGVYTIHETIEEPVEESVLEEEVVEVEGEPVEEEVVVEQAVREHSEEVLSARENQVLKKSDDVVVEKEKQTLIVSLSPEEAEELFEKDKVAIFLKTLPIHPVDRVVVYVTAPVKQVVGEFDLRFKDEGNVMTLWNRYRKVSTILRRRDYLEYYGSNREGKVLVASAVYKYRKPKTLADYDMVKGPSGFNYLR